MKHPCGVIRDLLPLYCDGVCSQESSQMVEEHLKECAQCRSSLEAMKEGEKSGDFGAAEQRKADSFRQVRKKLRRKQLLMGIGGVALAGALLLGGSSILKNIRRTVEYQDNIQVTMEKSGLVSQLEGTVWNTCASVTLETQEGKCLFFCFTDTAWDDLITGERTYSHYLLCPADKGAGEIQKVYYYTGDYPDLTEMDPQELEAEKEAAVLLWTRTEE